MSGSTVTVRSDVLAHGAVFSPQMLPTATSETIPTGDGVNPPSGGSAAVAVHAAAMTHSVTSRRRPALVVSIPPSPGAGGHAQDPSDAAGSSPPTRTVRRSAYGTNRSGRQLGAGAARAQVVQSVEPESSVAPEVSSRNAHEYASVSRFIVRIP